MSIRLSTRYAALGMSFVAGCSDPSSASSGASATWHGEPGRIWVTNSLRDSISEIDAANGSALKEYDVSSVGEEPANIDVCEGSVWFNAVAELGRITPARQLESLDMGAYDLVCGGGSVWVNTGLFVQRLNAATGAELASIDTEKLLYDPIAFGAGSAWVFDGVIVHRIDAATDQVSAKISLPAGISGLAVTSSLAFGEGSLWLLGDSGASQLVLIKIDPATNAAVAQKQLPTADATADLVAGFGSVWVSSAWDGDQDDDKLFAIDPTTLEIKRTISLTGAAPSTLELGASFVYAYATFATGPLDYERRVYKVDPGPGNVETITLVATRAGFDAIAKLAFEAK